jgi:hypothetical protein
MSDVRLGIVAGEPGIFPDPIARLLRLLGRAFGRKRGKGQAAPDEHDQRPDEEAGGDSP